MGRIKPELECGGGVYVSKVNSSRTRTLINFNALAIDRFGPSI
jgi:hypothetical protein